MIEDRPAWARRMTNEREARRWSQADAVRAMRAHAPGELPEDASLLRQWKRWESGEIDAQRVLPADHRQRRSGPSRTRCSRCRPGATPTPTSLAISGMDTLELVSRLQRSDLDEATLNGLRVMADSLVLGVPVHARRPAADRRPGLAAPDHPVPGPAADPQAAPGDPGPGRMGRAADRRAWSTTPATGRPPRPPARPRCRSAPRPTTREIQAWAHEIRAWMNLTSGDYHGVIAAAQAGTESAPHHGVAVQLAAQEAKAWARIGDRRQTEVALDRGRRLLDSMPYPENLDTTSWSIRPSSTSTPWTATGMLAEDKMAENLADEVIRASTDFDGTERAPMRLAEARVTLGVVAARQGDIEQAVHHGEQALTGPRKSLPSLLMVSRDLTRVLRERYPSERATQTYLRELQAIS